MTRFPDEEPDVDEDDWEGHWLDWTDSRRPVCDYCGAKGHDIRKCPVVLEENG